MFQAFHLLRCHISKNTVVSKCIIDDYITQRKAEKSERTSLLREKHREEIQLRVSDSQAVACQHTNLNSVQCKPELSQKTLYNYFDTRTGRMLQKSIEKTSSTNIEYDVFFSVSGLKAKSERQEWYSAKEVKSFKRMDPRLPLSGLNIFMWGIQKKDSYRRFRVWQNLSEHGKAAYRNKARELGAKISFFPLSPMPVKQCESSALDSFYKFIDEKWTEAEILAERPSSGYSNHVFLRLVKKFLIKLYQTPEPARLEIKLSVIPKTAFDCFAEKKDLSAVDEVQSSIQQQKHDQVWMEWCSFTDQERKKFIEEVPLTPAVPYFRPSTTEMLLDVQFDSTLPLHNADWYSFICNNYKRAIEEIDRKHRKKFSQRQANILTSVPHFIYSIDHREETWVEIKRYLIRIYPSKAKKVV